MSRMFAKLWLICMIAAMFLSGCTSTTTAPDPAKISVVATTTIVGDVVNQIAGNLIKLTILLPTGADPHAFEPKPVDIAAIADADLVFANGAGLETFMEPLIQNAGGDAKVIEISEGIPLIQFKDLHEAEAGSDEHGEYDPHVWHNPRHVMVWVENIAQALSQADPDHASDYQSNAARYTESLEILDAQIEQIVMDIPVEKRLLVTDHLTFGYFAQRYGFEVVESIIPGFSTLSSPSAQELATLQDQIRQKNIQAIFVGVSVNPALSEQIALDTGVQLVFVYTGALSEADQPAATYIQMMEYNAQAIAAALK